ncbi:hypothetical protein TomMM35A_33840 [Sphingobium sp. TomMM35A]
MEAMVMVSDEEVEAFLQSGIFDEQWYVNEYADVKISNIDPARHYLSIGRNLGRAHSGDKIKAVQPCRDGVDPHVYDVIASAFDINFYLSSYPDIRDAGVDPVWHYAISGWMEGRDPSLNFSTRYYLETYPDIGDAGVNPFYHFLVSGKAEGRTSKHELGFRYDILSRLQPVAEQIAIAKASRQPIQTKTPDTLCAAIAKAMANRASVILSFSHDDFQTHVGGVQLLLRRELKLLQEQNILQLNFHPVYPLAFMDTSGEDVLVAATIDGVPIGAYRSSDVVKAMRASRFKSEPTFAVHNLLGHNVEQVIGILEASGAQSGHFWIHDFAPLYNNYKLMRNDVEYSGIPRIGTMAWQLCEYARADFSHRDECAKLFDRFTINLIAPSQSALDIWKKAEALQPNSSRVIEHCALQERRSILPAQVGGKDTPLKIGYLGHPADHKGWPVFRELVVALAQDSRYEFHHIGSGRGNGLPISWRDVQADEARPDRMREAVELEELDVALIWSLWPETFCLIAYEALAGGAAILTNKAAGNVCDLAEKTGNGLVLDDEKQLLELFKSGDILKLSRAHRDVRHFDIAYSKLTVTCLEHQP